MEDKKKKKKLKKRKIWNLFTIKGDRHCDCVSAKAYLVSLEERKSSGGK